MFKLIILYFNTIKFLKPSQIFYRFYYKVKGRKIYNLKLPEKTFHKKKLFFLEKKNKSNELNKIYLINIEVDFQNNFEWDANNTSKLFLYNLHYFDFLCFSNENIEYSKKIEIIRNWIKKYNNPKLIGWDSYPTSLRIVNWIKFIIMNDIIDREIEINLFNQANYLSSNIEYNIEANHLISNLKALIFSGIYFNSKKILKIGMKLLDKEIDKQILSDGGHFETSPMYHAIVFEDFLDILNILSLNCDQEFVPIIDKLKKATHNMRGWIESIIHPDMSLPFFNDTNYSVASEINQLLLYASNNGIQKTNKKDEIICLDESGYVISRIKESFLITNISEIKANYQPGHSHADTLSFEFSFNNEKIIVNSGISTYEDNAQREYERSTNSHSTISVNNESSSEIWKSFRVARRAKIVKKNIKKGNNEVSIFASHNGFERFKKGVIHEREWKLSNYSLFIYDQIHGKYNSAISRIFFHPSIKIINKNIILTKTGKEIKIKTKNSYVVKETFWYPEFNLRKKNYCLEINLMNNTSQIELIW